MKNLTIIVTLLMLVSCGPRDRKAELERYRQKVKEYNEKIANIESELADDTAEDKKTDPVAVEIKEMIPESFAHFFEVTGRMEAIQEANISPEINGQIEEVLIERGARVKQGDLLIKLNTELTEKSIAEVKTSLELAERLFDKQEELWEQNIGSEIEYLQAKNNKESLEARLATLEKQLQMAHIRAPFSGIVDNIMVKSGELASPGMRLMHLVNLSAMRITANISEAYLNSIREGDEVEVRFASYPDLVIREKISRLGEVIDPQTRTFIMEIKLDNRNEKLKPNMLTSVRVSDYSERDALVVPSIILKQDFSGTYLFRVVGSDAGTNAEKVYVKSGITVQENSMIKEGLKPDDRVIIKGYNLVSDGTPVRIVNRSM